MTDFGDIRSLAHGEATFARWRELCDLLDQFNTERVRHEVVPYLMRQLSEWPAEVRVMPPRWFERLVATGDEPRATLASLAIVRGPDPFWEERQRDPWRQEGDINLHVECAACALSPDLSAAVLCDGADWTQRTGGEALIYDFRRRALGAPMIEPHEYTGECRSAQYSDDGQWIVLAKIINRADGVVCVFDADDGTLRWEQPLWRSDQRSAPGGDESVALAIDAQGGRVAGASLLSGEITIWGLEGGYEMLEVTGSGAGILPLDYAWDGSHVTTSHDDAGPTSLAFSPDGYHLAVGYRTGLVRIWDLTDASVVAEGHTRAEALTHVRFSRDGHYLVALSSQAHLWEWDADYEELTFLEQYPVRQNAQQPMALEALDNGQVRVATARGGEASVLDLPDGEWRTLRAEGYAPQAISLSPDGRWLFCASISHAWMWNLESRE